MLFSAMLARAKTPAASIESQIRKLGGDFDVHDRMAIVENEVFNQRRKAAVDFLRRGYTKGTVSTPTIPGYAVEYDPLGEYVADIVCPVVPGNIERKFPVWSRRDATRRQNLKMASDGSFPEASANVTFSTYQEVAYGELQRVDNNAMAQAAMALDLLGHHRRTLMGDLLREREVRAATLIGTSGNYASGCTSALAGTNRWDVGPATSTADPVKDIKITAMAAAAVAKKPNVMVASTTVLEYLRTHPKVAAAAGTRAADRVVSDAELAQIFGLAAVVEGKARHDTTGSASTATNAYIWGKFCALLYIEPGLSLTDMSWCKTFRHTPFTFRDETENTKGVRGQTILLGAHEDAEKVTASDCGYLLDTVVS